MTLQLFEYVFTVITIVNKAQFKFEVIDTTNYVDV